MAFTSIHLLQRTFSSLLFSSLLISTFPFFSFYYQVLELEGVIEGIERTASADQQMELELSRVINEVLSNDLSNFLRVIATSVIFICLLCCALEQSRCWCW